MTWNWELREWPKFIYAPESIYLREQQFFLNLGESSAFLKNIDKRDYHQFIIEILSQEGEESSRIEGEILDRESLQSSIKRHFGIQCDSRKENKNEFGMADLLCSVYENFSDPLTHQMLWDWHSKLFKENSRIADWGKYRTHSEPMQIVSNRYDRPRVFFEAPPSERVYEDMELFINWFNASNFTEPFLGRAAIAHVYFESIHPFEDGNGRIGRMLIEKMLSQVVKRPVLIAVSKILEQRKKEYYSRLESCNQSLDANRWVEFFCDAVLQAQIESMGLLSFLITKTKVFASVSGLINSRQEKVLLKMFECGPDGFKGGLSAENYISITKTSRATATRDLAELVHIGVLVRTGELRYTRYWLNLKIPFKS